jgi:type II secretory pathway pseudopilin PulG
MLRLKRTSDHGNSLIEVTAVTVLIGIVSAISLPNLFSLYRRCQVNKALEELDGAIKEVQRQAMRQGKVCRVNINTGAKTITSNPTNCILNQRVMDNSITIRTNLSGTPPNISFSSKGSTTKMGTIVVSSEQTEQQKCFVISLGLGISRTGNYTGSKTGSVSSTNCKTK